MNEGSEHSRLYGWDDGKIYFWDAERKEEFCVSEEEALCLQLTEICHQYFESKPAQEKK